MSRPNIGHPYGRFSSDPQLEGDGMRRQKAADFPSFCERFGFQLSDKVLFDEGVSAFDESNWDDDAELGRFVAKARRGVEVSRGDCLIVEDWDRLARLPWTRLVVRIAELFQAGIHLGDATRMRLIRYDSEDPGDAVDLIFGTSRGHGESKRKSGMVQKAKDERRRDAEAGKVILTCCLPCWIHIVPCVEDDPEARWYGSVKKKKWGKLALKKPEARILRKVFALAKDGLRGHAIVREMIRRRELCPFGDSWLAKQVCLLLRDRRVIGELPPARFKASKKRKGNGKAEHPAIPGYYPKLISEKDFYSLPANGRSENGRRGREAKLPNPFKGMIRDALSGESYYPLPVKQRDGTKRLKLHNYDGENGQGTLRSLDYAAFEDAVLSWLHEIDPADIVGESDAGRDVAALSGQLADCEQRREAFKASTRGKTMTPLLADEAIALDEEYERLKDQLAEAQARAAHPLSEAWGEQQSLIAAYRSAADPVAVRLRLRECLRRTVRQIWLLVVPNGHERLAAIQIDFHGDPIKRRHYIVHYWPGVKTQHYSRPARWEPVSWRSDDPWHGFDLASRDDAFSFMKALNFMADSCP